MSEHDETEFFYKPPPVVKLAEQILEMDHIIRCQQEELMELRRYKRDYLELLDQSAAHNQRMLRGLLDVVTVPGVVQAIAASNKARPTDASGEVPA